MLRHTGKPCVWSAAASIEAEGIEVNFRDDLSFPDLFHPEKKYTGAQPGRDRRRQGRRPGRRSPADCLLHVEPF